MLECTTYFTFFTDTPNINYFSDAIQWIVIVVLGLLGVVVNQLFVWANILCSPAVKSMVSNLGSQIHVK